MIVARHQESTPRKATTFKGHCNFDELEDDSYRTKPEQLTRVAPSNPAIAEFKPHPLEDRTKISYSDRMNLLRQHRRKELA